MSTEDEKGLDLSWTSDLKDVQAQRNGTTVGGTTEDDYCDERTEALPSDVDPDELTDTQRKIVTTAVIHPKATQREIAEKVECSHVYVGTTLEEHHSKHPSARVRGEMGRNPKRDRAQAPDTESDPEPDEEAEEDQPAPAPAPGEAERIKQARIAITAIQRSAGPEIEDALDYVVDILDGDEQ